MSDDYQKPKNVVHDVEHEKLNIIEQKEQHIIFCKPERFLHFDLSCLL